MVFFWNVDYEKYDATQYSQMPQEDHLPVLDPVCDDTQDEAAGDYDDLLGQVVQREAVFEVFL